MANISNELYEIMEAVTGEEVRGSIHRGLQRINNEITSTNAMVSGLNDALIDGTTVDISTFKQYGAGNTVSLLSYMNDFFLVPTILTKPDAYKLSFTLDLPCPFKPSANGYDITLTTLSIPNLFILKNDGTIAPSMALFNAIANSTLSSELSSYTATSENCTNKLHIELTLSSGSTIAAAEFDIPTIAFMHVRNVVFTVTDHVAT